jgi:hypothetical protein
MLLIPQLEDVVTFWSSEHYRLLIKERIRSPISIEVWLKDFARTDALCRGVLRFSQLCRLKLLSSEV